MRAIYVMLVVGVAFALAPAGLAAVDTPPSQTDLQDDGAGQVPYGLFEPEGPPRGTMLLLHGGGWNDRPGYSRASDVNSVNLQRSGWRVMNVMHHPHARYSDPDARATMRPSHEDVLAFVDQIKRAFPNEPLCIYGASSGAHLALMAATERTGIECVVSLAGPADIPSWQQWANDEAGGGSYDCVSPPNYAWRWAWCGLREWFDFEASNVVYWSPARRWHPGLHDTKVLIGQADNDPIVPPINATKMQEAEPEDISLFMGRGQDGSGCGLGHSYVRCEDAVTWRTRSNQFLADHSLAAPGTRTLPDEGAFEGELRTCDAAVPAADWAHAARGDRDKLLTATGRWQQAPDPGGQVAAPFGCSGHADSQLDGLGVYAIPGDAGSADAPAGRRAAQVLRAPPHAALTRLKTKLRGFVRAGWEAQVLAFAGADGSGSSTRVAACQGDGACNGFSTAARYGGRVFAPPGNSDPDQATPATLEMPLPTGTRRVEVRMSCEAGSCPLSTLNEDGIAYTYEANHSVARPADPTGSPGTLSFYDPVLSLSPTAPPDVSAATVAVAGTSRVGSRLTADMTGAQRASSYRYGWARCNPACQAIAGATASTYTPQDPDRGARLQATVTAVNAAGSAPPKYSPQTAPVTVTPPSTETCRGLAKTVEGLSGTAGDDVMVGTAGNDNIEGNGGNDTICGGEGFDTLAGGPGNDTLDGQGGLDAVEYGPAPGSVNVNLQTGRATGEGSDTLFSFTEAYGSAFNDTLRGSDSSGTNEFLAGGGGSDALYGGAGVDLLQGGPGNDGLGGGAGTDTLNGEDGPDRPGSTGDDTLTGGAGRDTLNGEAGVDTLNARDGEIDTTVNCGPGANETAILDGADPTALGCERSGRPSPTDRTPPQTTLVSGPSGTAAATNASFAFRASEPSSFQCSLDGDFGACASPRAYSGLSEAGHTFSVRAIDRAGNVDPTPATRGWVVDLPIFLPRFDCTVGSRRARLRSGLRRGLLASFSRTQSARVALRLTLARSAARRLRLVRLRRGGPVTVAKATKSGKSGKLRLRFSRKTRRALSRLRRVSLTLRFSASSSQSTSDDSGRRGVGLRR